MTLTKEQISITEQIASDFRKHQGHLSGDSNIRDLRLEAMTSFIKQSPPTRKNEEYKYSVPKNVAQVSGLSPAKNASQVINPTPFQIQSLDANTVVLVNGIYDEKLNNSFELPKEVIVCSLKTAFEKYKDLIEHHYSKYANIHSDPFIALNTAFSNDGLVIVVPGGIVVEKPFQVINLIAGAEPLNVFQRNLFVIGKNAEVKIIESIDSKDIPAENFSNILTEVVVGESAKVQYYKLQNDCANLNLINTTQVFQGKNAHFDTNTITLNGQWVRNNLNIVLNGQYCETHLNGLFITHDDQHVDNHTLVDHQQPNCQSTQLYKGILNDKSVGVFNGKIYVRKDAQKTNAYQSSKNILLSDNATINTKPQLEIYADDVKCSHGSSTGQIDPDAMFYLRARGVGEESAKRLLMLAFADDVVNTLRIDVLREYISELIAKRLNA